jgi:hypothetical protein
MFWLIDSIKNIELFCNVKHPKAYIEVIPSCQLTHPSQNTACALYVRPLGDKKGYIIPVDHSETLNLPYDVLNKVINSIGEIYVRDKKEFLHYFPIRHCYHPTPSPHPYIPQLTPAHKHIYKQGVKNLNKVVPIVKHYEVCEQNYINYDFSKANGFYNNKVPLVFNMLEQSAIKVNTTLYQHYFNKDIDPYVYTQYNLNTLTTRPSNTFGGINFSTLNKDTGERECFIPQNDFFLEMDISAYHPSLLASILDYDFGDVDVHKYLAEMYGVDYKKSKELTFKQIYGGVFKQYKDIPFFSKVEKYTQETWEKFQTDGYIECPISGYRYERDKLEDMNPQKLLNYILQNLETSKNVCILWDIFKIIRGKNTKLVLYVYDSFLFDVDKTEKETLKQVMDVFNKYKLKIKFKKGQTYNLDS